MEGETDERRNTGPAVMVSLQRQKHLSPLPTFSLFPPLFKALFDYAKLTPPGSYMIHKDGPRCQGYGSYSSSLYPTTGISRGLPTSLKMTGGDKKNGDNDIMLDA